jgi:hypothetical protein
LVLAKFASVLGEKDLEKKNDILNFITNFENDNFGLEFHLHALSNGIKILKN